MESYCFYRNGAMHGDSVEFHLNGTLKSLSLHPFFHILKENTVVVEMWIMEGETVKLKLDDKQGVHITSTFNYIHRDI